MWRLMEQGGRRAPEGGDGGAQREAWRRAGDAEAEQPMLEAGLGELQVCGGMS